MKIEENKSLKELNTFGIDAQCNFLVTYDSVEDLELLHRDEFFQESKKIFIGEGSNLLFLANFKGIVLISNIKDIVRLEDKEEEDFAYLRIGGGMKWDDLIEYSLENGLFGLENLSLIPGTVGAAARQNIGAYGTEICQFIHEVHAYDTTKGIQKIFTHDECNYSYRYSIFKEECMFGWVITDVVLKLPKTEHPNLEYKDLKIYFDGKTHPTCREVREAVIHIRNNKLPKVGEVGSAGSFFMNPILTQEELAEVIKITPDVSYHLQKDGKAKVSAGWLIDHAGLKGYRKGNVGVWDKQALVLCNYGGATGTEIGNLADYIQTIIKERYNIMLKPEVNFIY